MKILTQKRSSSFLKQSHRIIRIFSCLALLNFCCLFSKAGPGGKIFYDHGIPGPATVSAALNYCVSRGTNTSHGYINKVSIETINNTSGNNGGYGNYTNLSATLLKGASYSIELTPGFIMEAAHFEYWTVYIDYNQDGIFEPNEIVAKGNAAIRVIKSFTIPAAALNGPTRMRIQMQEGVGQTNPCTTYTYGEVEDYTVNIISNTRTNDSEEASPVPEKNEQRDEVNFMLYPNPAKDHLTLSFTASGNDRIKVNIYNLAGQKLLVTERPVVRGVNNISVVTSELAKGIYIVEIENNGVKQYQKCLIAR